MLQEMERALYEEDPRFASSLRDTNLSSLKTARTGLMALVAVAGISAIVAGVSMQMPLVGVAGFVATLAGLYGIVKAAVAQATAPQGAKPAKKPGGKGFLKSAEDRFRDRREGPQDR